MERFFQILAVILAGVAAYFLWQGNADRAFIAAVFGAVSFFLSVRFEVKGRLNQREAEREEEERRREGEEETEDGEFEDGEEFKTEDISDSEAARELNEIPAREQIGGERRKTDDETKI
jgi:hypothetical protein